MSTSSTSCRVCGAASATTLGTVEYVVGYEWDVGDCLACGCRFTRHDDTIYDVMHQSGGISYYSEYKAFAKQCREYFSRGDHELLERALAASSKYKFVIEEVARHPPGARLLEVGSSRGYLTSYFIMRRHNILGVDVSSEAVAEAISLYGDYFAIVGDPRIEAQGPYDLIYHVGLIGCVADPVGLSRELLGRLRPGGKLVFNAPNRAALALAGQLWVDSAPPPDLVTMFPRGFWTRQFSDMAIVTETEEALPPERALVVGLRQIFVGRWRKPVPKDLHQAGAGGHVWTQDFGPAWRLLERICAKAGHMTGLDRLAPARPTDFGLFVTMQRK